MKNENCLLIPYTEVCTLNPISRILFEGLICVISPDEFYHINDNHLPNELLDLSE